MKILNRIFIPSHYCIGIYLETYVEKGLLEDEWIALFSRIRSLRQADQYSLDARPSGQEAAAAIEGAGRFIDRIEKLLKKPRS